MRRLILLALLFSCAAAQAGEPLDTVRVIAARVSENCSRLSNEGASFIERLKNFPELASPEAIAHAKSYQKFMEICLDAQGIKLMIGLADIGALK